MREIKCRAWDEENKRFWNLLEINIPLNRFLIGLTQEDKPIYVKLDSLILEEYTGLKDKHGQEIYEGDIVYLAGYGNYKVEFPFIELYEGMCENDVEYILGNIHQNPELLETE